MRQPIIIGCRIALDEESIFPRAGVDLESTLSSPAILPQFA
jgi:hypothetical protein